MKKKKGSPCCDATYHHIYGIHMKWMPEMIQWKCSKCKKEYCEREMFEGISEENEKTI